MIGGHAQPHHPGCESALSDSRAWDFWLGLNAQESHYVALTQ